MSDIKLFKQDGEKIIELAGVASPLWRVRAGTPDAYTVFATSLQSSAQTQNKCEQGSADLRRMAHEPVRCGQTPLSLRAHQ